MLPSSTRQGNMDKENINGSEGQEPGVRITRARARALGVSGAAKTSINQDQRGVLKVSTKRQASEENKASGVGAAGAQCKKRAVLKEVTNTLTEGSYASSINATKAQTTKQAKRCPPSKSSKVTNLPPRAPKVEQENLNTKLVEGRSKVMMAEAQEIVQRGNLNEKQPCRVVPARVKHNATNGVFPAFHSTKGDCIIYQKQDALDKLGIKDIDTDLKDPLICSLYAPDIYKHIRVTELNQRPSADYMENLQCDVTPNMRGILIDWLVEVSEEYKLVPDTLYLTVNLIDRYLSKNYIEKQRLQLLGVTCMLIASKYEEICAPRVEEFCFITDNTYTKEEVLEMERRVLNLLHFQLSVPTPKMLLRRFIQAAQSSYKDPCVELELLANYLAELTLVEYNFIKILPSLVAASAVFLARWTLNQSDNPWNPTLEHYTNYKAPELKSTVLALEDLQLNTTSCPLNAIREKYRHQKFKSVANLTSPERVQSLFER